MLVLIDKKPRINHLFSMELKLVSGFVQNDSPKPIWLHGLAVLSGRHGSVEPLR